ncbi:hypothetical protein BJ684DRAFT_18852 [Piptocephalis cylindrospora]|uniref:Uncharacterized protein n=1 Tax=Piptocephalis cylindrospora TaxID=1907219 RepID=A0A4P9Y9R0_9FUNG|nr:hypothetical protein BJ684DRAFT_18852 [Piptocephalis cylindrospora]|eukprot:RKP14770.1 hypothetical protein BJ684DRAFT_18852 [Piptocephalis cylindrospora]
MVIAEVDEETGTDERSAHYAFRDSQGQRTLLNQVVKDYQILAREACEKMRQSVVSNEIPRLLVSTPGSLVDIYCTVMNDKFDGTSYVPIVKAFHKAIGYSGFLCRKKDDALDRPYEANMLRKSRLSETLKKERWIDRCRQEASRALGRTFQWASTSNGGSVLSNPAKAFFQYTVALMKHLLETHEGKAIDLPGNDLSLQAVKKTLSSKKL